MFGVAPQSIDVSTVGAGADTGYVFAFDPGDLGRKRFASVPLRINGDALEMTYTDAPITELQGRPFRTCATADAQLTAATPIGLAVRRCLG